MRRILVIGMLLISAPALAQSQTGATPVNQPDTSTQSPSTKPAPQPWTTLPATPYKNWAEEVGAVSTHNELRQEPIQASEPKKSCDAAKGELCPKEPPKQ